MKELKESVPITLSYKLKETSSLERTGDLQRILNVVSDGFVSWYGLRPSFLNLDSVRFVSEEEFNKLATLQYHKENFLIKALSMLGVSHKDILSPFYRLPSRPSDLDNYLQNRKKDLEFGLYVTDPTEFPNTIFVREERFQVLEGRNSSDRDLFSIILGIGLGLLAVETVPQPTEVSDELWRSELRDVLAAKINVFLSLHASKIPPEKIPSGSSATDLIKSYVDEDGFFHDLIYGKPEEGIMGDETLKFFAQGGRIFAVLEDHGKERGLLSFGADFHRQVATILNGKLSGYIISHFTEQYGSRVRASMLEKLRERED